MDSEVSPLNQILTHTEVVLKESGLFNEVSAEYAKRYAVRAGDGHGCSPRKLAEEPAPPGGSGRGGSDFHGQASLPGLKRGSNENALAREYPAGQVIIQ